MSMNLIATDKDLNAQLRQIDQDDVVSPVEFQALRDRADEAATQVAPELREALLVFQKAADQTAEALQKLGLQARKLKLGVPDQDVQKDEIKNATKAMLKKCVEFQLAYVVVGYKSSLEAL